MRQQLRRVQRIRPAFMAVAVAACFAAPAALALPTGPVVVHGTALFQHSGKLLQVTNSPNAIINWQGFSIGAGEVTRFIQQSGASAVLNRVVGQDPSAILGALQSNGRVFLINPNGIVFGAGAQVDVAGLVASTLNLANADFLAARMKFTEVPGAGSVVNEGAITTGQGGTVYLVGSGVTNSGVITTPKGEVVLAAGNSVELVNPGTPSLRVEISAPDNGALNLGSIVADAGRVGIYAGLINHSGTIRADSAQLTEDGRVVLKATKSVTVEAGSVTTANGPSGGLVSIQSAETTLVAGAIEAKGAEGTGGTIQVLGNLVGLVQNATIDASGASGGGVVLVGGDFQGRNPDIQNAFRTYVGPEAVIRADATANGDGGRVIVWADDVTRLYGTIRARGGEGGGNGGFAEVSGKNWLDFQGFADLRAPAGAIGTLLLDPSNITVANSGAAPLTAVDQFGDPGGTVSISPATLNAAGATVVLQATSDITVQNAVNLTTAGAGFVAQAGRNITVDATITTNGGVIHLEADTPHRSGGPQDQGQLRINSTLNSNGGAITLIAGAKKLDDNEGGFRFNADINAGGGGINISLSNAPTKEFRIGTDDEQIQLRSADVSRLKTTGALVLGQATSAGTNGLGAGALTLKVDKLTYDQGTMTLSAASGSSFQLIAGNGGIVIDQPLTTYQTTILNTTGDVNLKDPLVTNNNDLTISAKSLIISAAGSIDTGTGAFFCSVISGACPASATGVFWDGGGGDLNWFNALNWSTDLVPDSTKYVRIGTGFGTVQVATGVGAQARNLVADSPLQIASGSLTLAEPSSFNHTFTLSGGSLLGAGNVTVGSTSGALTWSGGTMGGAGSFTLASGRSGTVSNAVTLNRLFTNSGTLTLSSANVSGTGSITNPGTLLVGNSTLSVPIVNSSPVQFTGTNLIASGSGITGGTVEFLGGTTTFQATSAYNVATTNVNGGAAVFDTTASTTALNVSSGSLGGSGDVTVSGSLDWSGGTIAGGGAFTVNGVLTMPGAGTRTLDGRTLVHTNASGGSAILAADGARLDLDNGAVLRNAAGAVLSVAPASGTVVVDRSAGAGTFDNQGTLLKNGAGTLDVGSSGNVAFNNSGLADVVGGTLKLGGGGTQTGTLDISAGTTAQFAGGTHNLNAGSVTGIGTLGISGGAVNVAGAVAVSSGLTFSQTGGTLDSTANLTINPGYTMSGGTLTGSGNVTINGPLDWSGGTISGGGAFTVNGVLTMPGAGTRTLDGRTLVHANTSGASTILGAAGAELDLNNGAVLRNAAGAVLNVATPSGTAFIDHDAGAGGVVDNLGTLVKSGAGTLDIGTGGAVSFANPGTLDVQAGTAIVNSFASGSNAGTINIASGAALSTNGNALTNAGTITGSGTLNLGSATLTNNGALAPGTTGDPTGTLAITGNFTQGASGALNIQLGGTGAGEFDALNVSGGATLGGTMNVATVGGFAPVGGNTFQVITCAGSASCINGTFATVNSPAGVTSATTTYNPMNATWSVDLLGGFTVNYWNVDASGDWNVVSNWSLGRVPLSTDAVVIDRPSGSYSVTIPNTINANALQVQSKENLVIATGGTLTVTNPSGVDAGGTLTISGGTLSGTAATDTWLIGGNFNWTGGTINAGGQMTIATGGSGSVQNAVSLNRALQNSGAITLSSATLGGTGSVNNQATMTVNNSTLSVPVANASPVQFTGGTNTVTGTGSVTGGTVDFLGGTTTFVLNSIYNVGTTNISGAATRAIFDNTAATATTGTLNLSSGNLEGSGNLTVSGAFNWSGGTVTGAGAFTTNGTSTLSGAADKDLVDRTWTNAGVVNLTGGRLDLSGSTGVFTNQAAGVFNVTSTSGSIISGGAGNAFNNQGTFNKNAAGTGAIDGAMSFSNTGTVNANFGTMRLDAGGVDTNGKYSVASGATLQFNGGTRTLSGTADISGTGAVAVSGGTLNVNNAYSIAASGTTAVNGGTLNLNIAGALSFANTLSLSGGTLGGNANLTLAGLDWSGGTVTGAGAFTTNGTSTLSGAADKDLVDRAWTNAGTVNLTGGRLDLSGSTGVFTNQAAGVFNVTSTSGSIVSGNAGNVFNNQGTFNTNAAGTGAIDGAMSFNNTGTVNANAGTLRLDVSGTDTGTYNAGAGAVVQFNATHAFNAGAALAGSGTVQASSGTLTVNGTLATPASLTFELSGAATLTGGGAVTLNGDFNWSGGTVTGAGAFTTNGTSTLSGAADKALLNRTWTNAGVVNLTGGRLDLPGATGVFTNQATGVFSVTSTSGSIVSGNAGNAFNNQGTFNKNAAGTAAIDGAMSFSNTGTVNVNAGTLQINNFASNSNAGTLNISSGTALSTNGNPLTNAASGVITGAGTLDLAGATLTNNGTIRAGTSAGKLTVTGNLNLGATSVIDIELGGTTQGVNYDWIAVSGAGTLGGTMNVTEVGGFFTSPGDSFQVITCGATCTGAFATISAPADVTLAGVTNANDFTLNASAVATRWSFAGSGDWTDAAKWTRGVPTGGHDAVIDVAGTSETVTIGGGAQAARSLSVPGDEVLAITGGSLDLSNASVVSGTLALSGGTLQGAGNVTVGGAFNWSGGTVAGAGQLTTNGTSTLSGAADKDLVDRVWTNAGVVNLTGGRLDLQGSTGVFTNQTGGVLNVSTSSGSLISGGAGNAFNNQGTFNKNAAGTGAIDGAMSFNNTGAVNVNAGTLRLDVGGTDTGSYSVGSGNSLQFNGGTRNLNAGSNVTGAGNVNFSGGTTNIASGFGIAATGTTTISGGTANFNGGSYSFGNTVNVSGGTLGGSATLTNLGTFNVGNGTVGASFVNQGAFNVTGGTSSLSGATFDMNGGVLDVAGGATLTKTGGVFNWNGGALSGTGNLTMNGGASFNIVGGGARTLDGPALSVNNLALNAGSLALQSGMLNASGTTTIANGAILAAQGGTLNAAGGTINVSGVFEAGGAAVTANAINVLAGGLLQGGGAVSANVNNVAGTVAPGASMGTLTINGNYTQGAAGSLAVKIGGMMPSVQYDQLMVAGNATLDGTLGVTFVNGFVPVSGSNFTVVQGTGTVSGVFGSTSFPASPALSVNYLPSSVNLAAASSLIPQAVVQTIQSTIGSADQSTESEATNNSSSDEKKEKEKKQQQKLPVCTGASAGAAAAAVRPAISAGGGRCTARGCF